MSGELWTVELFHEDEKDSYQAYHFGNSRACYAFISGYVAASLAMGSPWARASLIGKPSYVIVYNKVVRLVVSRLDDEED